MKIPIAIVDDSSQNRLLLADQMKQATARAQDTANAQRLSKLTFQKFFADQQQAQQARATTQANQNAAASTVIGPYVGPGSTFTTPYSTPAAGSAGSASMLFPDTSPGTIIGNGSVLGPLTAPAASFLPPNISSSLPAWAQGIPLWGAVAGIAGLAFAVYSHTTERKTRR